MRPCRLRRGSLTTSLARQAQVQRFGTSGDSSPRLLVTRSPFLAAPARDRGCCPFRLGWRGRRAHESACGGIVCTAFADSDAPVRGTWTGRRDRPAGRNRWWVTVCMPGSRSSVIGCEGSTMIPGLSTGAGSKMALNSANAAQRGGGVHQRQTTRRGLAIAVLPGQRSTVPDDQRRRRLRRNARKRWALGDRQIESGVDAAVTDMTI